MTHDIECPYCGEFLDINHDDGYGYREGVTHTQECSQCFKTFGYQTSVIFHYETIETPCLIEDSGVDHKWILTHTIPREASRMRCEYCDEERELTDQERERYHIGTMKEYFDSLKTK